MSSAQFPCIAANCAVNLATFKSRSCNSYLNSLFSARSRRWSCPIVACTSLKLSSASTALRCSCSNCCRSATTSRSAAPARGTACGPLLLSRSIAARMACNCTCIIRFSTCICSAILAARSASASARPIANQSWPEAGPPIPPSRRKPWSANTTGCPLRRSAMRRNSWREAATMAAAGSSSRPGMCYGSGGHRDKDRGAP
mmetsp:Transcript_43208/g.122175  ORF Transcript_43208/g.122175 Transcript_43208/m.122175 type:complete len:200 (-) Transcript_43208:11-610(-)